MNNEELSNPTSSSQLTLIVRQNEELLKGVEDLKLAVLGPVNKPDEGLLVRMTEAERKLQEIESRRMRANGWLAAAVIAGIASFMDFLARLLSGKH